MEQVWETDNRKLTLAVTIYCEQGCRFQIVAEDLKPNSRYVDREINVVGSRTIELKFPVSPKRIKIRVKVSPSNPSKPNFMVQIEEKELTTYNIHLDQTAEDFLKLAIPFCQVCGFTPVGKGGRIYSIPSRQFNIRFIDKIRDAQTGKVYNTPARVGHTTGIIEISKEKYDKYTIPMRLIILLHEFSHKYRNEKMGLPISHEIGADINALYIYLGLGFSKVDAIYVFANVFLKAQTPGNIKRMRKIQEYITKFENEEFAKKN
jgi:hypothetical protein